MVAIEIGVEHNEIDLRSSKASRSKVNIFSIIIFVYLAPVAACYCNVLCKLPNEYRYFSSRGIIESCLVACSREVLSVFSNAVAKIPLKPHTVIRYYPTLSCSLLQISRTHVTHRCLHEISSSHAKILHRD